MYRYKKIKKDDKDDIHLLKLLPSDEDENLITISNQMSIPETLNLLKGSKEEESVLEIFNKNHKNKKPNIELNYSKVILSF